MTLWGPFPPIQLFQTSKCGMIHNNFVGICIELLPDLLPKKGIVLKNSLGHCVAALSLACYPSQPSTLEIDREILLCWRAFVPSMNYPDIGVDDEPEECMVTKEWHFMLVLDPDRSRQIQIDPIQWPPPHDWIQVRTKTKVWPVTCVIHVLNLNDFVLDTMQRTDS